LNSKNLEKANKIKDYQISAKAGWHFSAWIMLKDLIHENHLPLN